MGYKESHEVSSCVVSSVSDSSSVDAPSSPSSTVISAVRTSSGTCSSTTAGATSPCSAATMACSTSAPAINSNESNRYMIGAGGGNLEDAVVVSAVVKLRS